MFDHYPETNGGPPLDDEGDAKMRWVRVNIGDLLEGLEGLSWEERGYYVTAMFKMYARMSGLPYDERDGATAMRCDIRTYRRLRDALLKQGKFYRDGEFIRNARVESEITRYCREFKRRQDAAREREKRRRDAYEIGETSPELPADFDQKSGKSQAKVGEKSPGSLGEVSENGETKSNEFNGGTTRILPERDQNGRAPNNQEPITNNQEPIEREEREGGFGVAIAPLGSHDPISDLQIIPPRSDDVRDAFEAYNAVARRVGLAVANTLTPDRRKKIQARMREHGGPLAWQRALDAIERSAFLQGRNDRGWKAHLDFVLQPASFTKLVDGVYGNGAHAEPKETSLERMMRLSERVSAPMTRRPL